MLTAVIISAQHLSVDQQSGNLLLSADQQICWFAAVCRSADVVRRSAKAGHRSVKVVHRSGCCCLVAAAVINCYKHIRFCCCF
ncbi:hypothetical protein QVD17_39509 [Tagetes erecta]|uniref:Uncharacterized protein n=1 Tax=Tagetes erecta TaxID=13708 RepID=A0AAD8NGA5_TARER|nr:hypothetical protein QVD17_39509 [Tagetes erecta]